MRKTTGCFMAILAVSAARIQAAPMAPAVGATAKNFSLKDLSGETVELSALEAKGPVVLVVLRGFPGYQCPVCSRQMGELLGKAGEFTRRKATVLLVYPGPAKNLDEHARQFIQGKKFPANFRFVVDPDFAFTELYGLRWAAPLETAYPSSFVVDPTGKILFAKVSTSHGGRSSAQELLDALPQ